MILIGKKRAAHVVLVKEIGRRMAVVDRKHVSAFQPAANFADPVARFQSRLGVLPFAQRNILRCKIFGDGARRKRRQDLCKVPVAEVDENLFQCTSIHHDPVHRQRIDQFIGKDAAFSNARRNLNRSHEASGSRMTLRVNRSLFAPLCRPLHSFIVQRFIKGREFRLTKIEDLGSKPPGTRSRLNKREFRRAVEVVPHFNELSRQETGEDGVHVGAGVVIRETLGLRFAVIAMHRMVEAFAHVVRERKGAEAANAVGK